MAFLKSLNRPVWVVFIIVSSASWSARTAEYLSCPQLLWILFYVFLIGILGEKTVKRWKNQRSRKSDCHSTDQTNSEFKGQLKDPISSGQRTRFALILLAFFLSFSWYRIWDQPSNFQKLRLPNPAVVKVEGRVKEFTIKEIPKRFGKGREKRTRLVLQLSRLWIQGASKECDGVIVCNGKGNLPSQVTVGSLVQFLAIRNPAEGSRNPGGFDPAVWLKQSGFAASCQLVGVERVKVVSPPTILQLPDRIRRTIRDTLLRRIQPRNHGLAASVILGDRSFLEVPARDRFVETGTIHLLAISGLHLGILAGCLLLLARVPFLPCNFVFVSILIFVWFYAWLVGFRPPILRAAILLSVLLLGKIRRRQSFSFHSLALSFVCVFIVNPLGIFQPGTHLSFLAVATILWQANFFPRKDSEPLEQLKLEKSSAGYRCFVYVWNCAKRVFLVSFFIFLVTIPLVFHHFHICGWIGIGFNPLLLAPMTLSLFFGVIFILLDLLAVPFAFVPASVCNVSFDTIDYCVKFCHQLKWGRFWGASPGRFWIFCFYLIWIPFLMTPKVVSVERKMFLFRCVSTITVSLFILSYYFPVPRRPLLFGSRDTAAETELVVALVDVGHGQCVFVQTKSGKNLLYDCGSFVSGRNAAGRISKFLFKNGIDRLDSIVISHDDSDHYNAMGFLLDRFGARQLWVTPSVLSAFQKPGHVCFGLLDSERTRVLKSPDCFELDNQWKVEVLSPNQDSFSDGDNSNSLVLLLRSQFGSVLLTGDLEGQGLKQLLKSGLGEVSILQVPHHGSPNSLPRELANRTRPHLALISQGRTRISKYVFCCYEKTGSTVKSTALEGAIVGSLHSDRSVNVRSWKKEGWRIR